MKISPMTLGTVQLGMNYGIANESGKPDEEKSFAILNAALSNGVNFLDTARGYGDSEKVIGRFLKTWKGKAPGIVTKIPPLQGSTPKDLERFAVASVERSLQALGLNKVDAVMLHGAKDPAIYGSGCVRAVKTLLEHGYTDHVGVSVYTPEDVESMLRYDVFSLTQVPMNIFDQRLITGGWIRRLEQQGYTVFVRSVFLQGLFFLDPDRITDPILQAHAVPKLRLMRSIAQQENMTVAQLAIAFIRDCPGVSSLVLGAETPWQVADNIAYFDTPPLSQAVMEQLNTEFGQVDIAAIMQVLSRPKQ